MRTFVVLCLVAAAAAQYEYSAQSGSGISANGGDDFSAALDASAQNDYAGSSFAPVSDFDKEFFSFSAPEGEFDDSSASEKIANSLKKNLRVVFIKGPENAALENAALQLAKSAADQRTAIYVLNKQADIGALANKLNSVNKNASNKPEVHFVKYRTQADAENAQRTIQAQFESLPGSSTSSNGGNAPVLDFASKSPSAAGSPTSSYIPPQSAYLPAGRRF